MRLLQSLALAFLPCLLVASFTPLLRADEKIPIKDLPLAVTKAIEKRLPGAELLSAKKEKDDGKIKYEVKVKHDGKKYEVEVTEDGKILEVEREDD